MGNMSQIGRSISTPAALLSQAALQLSRRDIEQIAQSLIDRLDTIDGDPDREPDDHDEEDDPQGQCDEEGVNTLHDRVLTYAGPGCVISDEDFVEPAAGPHAGFYYA